MKAIDGNLRVDQSYKLIDQQYHGKFADNLMAEQCQNCGNGITNIAVVHGSDDGRDYRIGLDCASVLTGILPDAIKQAKKVLRKKAKFMKFLAVECKLAVTAPDDAEGHTLYTDPDAVRWGSYKWRCNGSIAIPEHVQIITYEEMKERNRKDREESNRRYAELLARVSSPA
jgi:hypothetical protein